MPSKLGLAAAFARSWFSYLIDGAPRPISAAYCVTNRCNLRCEYCNIPFLGDDELDLARVEIVLDRLWKVGVRRMGFSGGEPLVRRDIGEVLAAARRRGYYVTLNTNLMLYRRKPEIFDDVNLVLTSLDGDREAHEASRGKGAFDGVVDAIADLVARRMTVVAICVLTHHSFGQLGYLLDTADELGFKLHLQTKCVDTLIVRGPRPQLSNELEREFWQRVLELKRQGRPIASSEPFLETLANWRDFGTMTLHDPEVRCAAGRGFLYVDPLGHAFPCSFLKGRVESIDLLAQDWRTAALSDLPCTRCIAGPLPEFNLLYQQPLRACRSALRFYV